MTAFKVPVRKPRKLGLIQVELGDNDVRNLDVYRACDIYAIANDEVWNESKATGDIALVSEVLVRWAAMLFRQQPDEWCPESAAALWSHVQGVVAELKKSGSALVSPASPSSTEPTASPLPPTPSVATGSESPSI